MGRIDTVVSRIHPESRILCLFLALALARGLLYSALIPPWQAPDEPQHYQMVRQIWPVLETGRMSEEVAQSLHDNKFWEYRYRRPAPDHSDLRTDEELLRDEKLAAATSHPPAYYILASLVISPFRSSPVLVHLYMLRALSTVLSMVAVWCIFTLGRWLSPNDASRTWAAALFAILLPMRAFMAAAVNNDALAEMLASVALTLVIWGCFRGVSVLHGLALVILLLLCLFTKRTTLFLIPLILVFLGISRFHGRSSMQPADMRIASYVRFALAGRRWARWGVILLLSLTISLIVLALVYDGATRHWWDLPIRASQLFLADRYTWDSLNHYGGWILLGFASFWGNFGWMNIPLDVEWYAILAILTVGAGLGALRGAWRAWRAKRENPVRCCAIGFCALAVFLACAQGGASVVARQIPLQGRYLFPAVVPIAVGWVWGLFEWIPVKYHRLGLSMMAVGLILLDMVSVLGYVLPYFYG